MTLQTYISNLPIIEQYKEQILDENFIYKNPSYYQNYPSLFSNVFSVTDKQINLLDIAGFLYYKATIFSDGLIDNKDTSKFLLISICQEESIKILTSFFGLEGNFWNFWNERKNEYFYAVSLEKTLLEKADVSINEYETLADCKSSFGKIAIDCLYNLDNQNNKDYKLLLLSHKYFSVAFQLNDDIQDFKNDIINGQFNFAVYLLKKQNIEINDPAVLEKYFYIRGVSKQLYNLGIQYCIKSLDIVRSIDVPKWKSVLNDTIKSFNSAIIEVDNYIEILTSEILQPVNNLLDNNVGNSIKNACNYIKSQQQPNGCWREYVNQGGISDIWATSFILSKISESDILKMIFQSEISKSIDFLVNIKNQRLWGYNTTWIEDADSTNFAFLSFFFNKVEISPALYKNWIKFQQYDYGFSTYSNSQTLLKSLDDRNISNVDGWTKSQNCVSAVSFYFLANYNPNQKDFLKVKKYFDINFDTKIKSYWWSSDIYVYYYLAKSYFLLNDFEKLSFFVEQVNLMQNVNGSFSDKYGENLFYTGLALEILLYDSNSKLAAENALRFLLKSQLSDGSWPNSNALQIPASSDLVPSQLFFPVSTFGMNVRAKEFNRLFTTASIIQSISLYEKIYNTTDITRYHNTSTQ
ncbi:prenyltransferase/squalene oxidase repeat-containing protein [Flavobacterium sp.]|jgi:hypothetical protein|uniref:prenyltransferase/squalene oxidase repeat-containing protein n=1 Tax=Flavobacterium sp. TaxID=239 RepID=UPI0037BE92CC